MRLARVHINNPMLPKETHTYTTIQNAEKMRKDLLEKTDCLSPWLLFLAQLVSSLLQQQPSA